MTFNFGSELLDVMFALSFIFFLLSLIVSAGTEAISWFLQQRAKNLEDGLKTLLADENGETQLSQDVLGHPLVKGMRKSRWKGLPQAPLPSYVSPRNFALALLDVIREPGRELGDAIAGLPEPMKRSLVPLANAAGGEVDRFRESVERWYDDAMERVSGWYKRWAQWVTVLFALVVTVGLNVDTLRVTDRLFNDEAVRSAVVAAGENTLEERTREMQSAESADGAGRQGGSESATETEGETSKSANPVAAGKDAEKAVEGLTALKLPIGWDAANEVNVSTLAGWLITILAISLGAPFWFGALGRLANLRAAGGKPEEKRNSE
jgi:hypothetical protein